MDRAELNNIGKDVAGKVIKEYQLLGVVFNDEDLGIRHCDCLPWAVKEVLHSALSRAEGDMVEEAEEQQDQLVNMATKGSKEAGEIAESHGQLNVFKYAEFVDNTFHGDKEDIALKLRDMFIKVKNTRCNRWEAYHRVKGMIYDIPVCKEGRPRPEVDASFKPPHYDRMPWEG